MESTGISEKEKEPKKEEEEKETANSHKLVKSTETYFLAYELKYRAEIDKAIPL